MLNKLIENQQLVERLWDSVNTCIESLENLGPLVRRILETEAWKRREVASIGIVEFDHFIDFIRTPPLRGCGWNPEKLVILLSHTPEVLDMYQDALGLSPFEKAVQLIPFLSLEERRTVLGVLEVETRRRVQ
jgi:hypothetical protein